MDAESKEVFVKKLRANKEAALAKRAEDIKERKKQLKDARAERKRKAQLDAGEKQIETEETEVQKNDKKPKRLKANRLVTNSSATNEVGLCNNDKETSNTVVTSMDNSKARVTSCDSNKFQKLKTKQRSSTKRAIKTKINSNMTREKIRERVWKHREKLKNNPEALEEYKRKDRERYHNKKKEGRVISISKKSIRDQRNQRKAWRANSKRYRQRQKLQKQGADFMEASSPDSDANAQQEEHIRRKKSNLKQRKTEKALKKALAMTEKYKKRYHCLKSSLGKQQNGTPSPSTKVGQLLQGETVSPPVRKRLVFCESLVAQLKQNRKLCNNENEHRTFSRCTAGKILKKYKVQNMAKPFLTCKQNMQLLSRKKRETIGDLLRNNVESFLEQDDVSRLLPGKKDCITKNKVKKQIRILNDSLLNLHKKFKSTQGWKISYATFCRMRPFWIREPRHLEQPTCLCVKHTNIKFVVSKLYQIGILKENRPEDICPLVCCDENSFKCMTSLCLACKEKNATTTDGIDMTEQTFFFKWVTNKLEKRPTKNGEITVKVTLKEKITCTIQELVQTLNASLPSFLEHVWRVRHQFLSIKELKSQLKRNEAIIHIDFSENYECKFSEEPQSVHFGASRKQITLHTGVLYYNDVSDDDQLGIFNIHAFPFCSLSESTRHDPEAIWAHLKPVGELVRQRFPEVDTVHFLSDGPSTQYKNKKNFFLFVKYAAQMFNAKRATWNFSAAGHGKGAANGVGGTLNRTADCLIAQGNDIPDAKTLLDALKPTCEGVHIFPLIHGEDIETIIIPSDLTTIPGTMKIHQVSWDDTEPRSLKLRDASCFLCAPDKVCIHFVHNEGFWNFGDHLLDTSTACEPKSSSEDRIVKGSWVAVIYDDTWYPGEVELVSGNQMQVNFMAKSGSQFIWPAKSDRQTLVTNEILCILPAPPVPVSKRHFAFENIAFVEKRLAEVLSK